MTSDEIRPDSNGAPGMAVARMAASPAALSANAAAGLQRRTSAGGGAPDILDGLPLVREEDVVTARQRARQIAGLLGFDNQDQARIATAVSEIARNAVRYARDGSIEYRLEGASPPYVLIIRVSDRGPGIANLQAILDGNYRSATGMGLGIVGARRLMDQCEISTGAGGTVVVMKKLLELATPPLAGTRLERLREELRRVRASTPVEELQQQQRELLVALAEARERQDQLSRLNRELEDTNRGVVALYAELDEKADHLRRADDMKSRFLSNMSHEFRTPLNSIRALSQLLVDRVDGALSDEQERQVQLIRKAADDLSGLVEDLLDIARIEAGKLEMHVSEFSVDELFSALRGMLRPLLVGESVALRFVPPSGLPPLLADEGKVSQVLRNFISNALKFTERGSVTVSVTPLPDRDSVVFCVADTGIGIAREDQERIFDEFVQIRGHLQTRVKGTGLGLPLCRRLAHALGGEVYVESEPGVGSRFFFRLPTHHAPAADALPDPATPARAQPSGVPVLIVEDEPDMHVFYERILRDTGYRPILVSSVHDARAAIERARPAAIILDILLRNEDAWRWLAEVKGTQENRFIPVLVVTTVEEERKALALGADAFMQKPVDRVRILALLDEATRGRVLIVDDDATTRYAIRKLLEAGHFPTLEVANGEEAKRVAEIAQPRAIVLDLGLPDIDGSILLEAFAQSVATRDVPVIVATARDLSDAERVQLEARAFAVLRKSELAATLVATVSAAIGAEAVLTRRT
jgi:signal transduction histidine kinase/CheY-like chemotaxis protein